MKQSKVTALRWIAFSLCWILLWNFVHFYDVYQSNIPQEIFDSGYFYEGGLSSWGLLVVWGSVLYFAGYLATQLYLFFTRRMTRIQLAFFAGTPVFVVGLIVLVLL